MSISCFICWKTLFKRKRRVYNTLIKNDAENLNKQVCIHTKFYRLEVDTDFENNINGRVKKFALSVSRDTQHDRWLIFCFPAVCSKTTREGISVVGSHSLAILHNGECFHVCLLTLSNSFVMVLKSLTAD